MDNLGDVPARPLSIKEISENADKYTFNPAIALKYWLRAADAILQEARVAKSEGNFANAYMLFLRHSSLVLGNLSTHPEAKQLENKQAIRGYARRIPQVLQEMEEIKPHIQDAYEEWAKIKASQRELGDSRGISQSAYEKHAAMDPALSWNAVTRAKVLDAGENQDLAVDLATREIQRRAARRATRKAGISEEEEHERRTGGVWDGWDAGMRPNRLAEDQELRRQMEATRRTLDRADGSARADSSDRLRYPAQSSVWPATPRAPSSAQYHYPSISRSAVVAYEPKPNRLRKEPPTPQPPRPAKISLTPPPPYRVDTPPALPEKEPLPSYEHRPPETPSPLDLPELPPKEIEASPKPRPVTFRPAAYLEDGTPIRPVFIPDMLRKRFLEIASENTNRGLEMCGMLCGTPVNNALFISVLLIPEQKCTSDTCETENESAMLDYCINHDLLVVGWIHTHPTQTCFMSSRDLHTQAGYQVMMPESIAIVCAPRHIPSWGIFRLTSPPGLQHILQCSQSDTFHQHAIDNIYTDASHPPGHVYETPRLDFTVHDLRPDSTK